MAGAAYGQQGWFYFQTDVGMDYLLTLLREEIKMKNPMGYLFASKITIDI